MDTIRIGIIGVGNMGSAHAACIAAGEVDGLTLGALCDSSLRRRQTLAQKYPTLPIFGDAEELFASGLCDAVIVAVPHPLHAQLAMAAFRHGLHVLVEKPVDVTVSQARRLNEAAEKSGKVFAIMFNQRTNPLFAQARQLVHSGQLGELRRTTWIITNWFRTQRYYDSGDWRATWAGEGGGVLLNQAPHNLDLWQWICGMPESVTAYCEEGKYHRIEVEDEATLFTRYANGATGLFVTSTGEYPGTNRLEIVGDRGKLVLENGMLTWDRLKVSVDEAIRTSENGFAQPETEALVFKQETPETAHRGILQNFSDGMRLGTPLLSPGVEGIHELTLSNAAYLSQWSGNTPVSLPLDEERFDALLRERAQRSSFTAESPERACDGTYLPRWQVRW